MTQTSKRAALIKIIGKLSKLIPYLASDKPGEVFNTAEAIRRTLGSVGLDFHDLVTLLSAEEEALSDLLTKLLERPEDTLIRLGREGASFFHSAEHVPFADIVIGGHRVTWPLPGDEFSDWLVHQYFIEKKKAPPAAALKAAIRTLSAHSRFECERHAVYLRVAEIDGVIFLDLGNGQGQAVEINQNGWQIVDRPHARFRRAPEMAAMPLPQRGGKIDDLRRFINFLHREVVWVILANFERLSSVVVAAVGMWATRLRCPSCPQRGRRCRRLDPCTGDKALPSAGATGNAGAEARDRYRAGSMQVRILSRR